MTKAPGPPFERFSADQFRLQSSLLRRLPPLTNDRVFHWSLGLLLAQGLCATIGGIALQPALTTSAAAVGLLLIVAAHGLVLLLTFAGDALPEEYARIVNIRERLHPITMAALVYLLLSHVTAFATGYCAIQQLDVHTWADDKQPDFLGLWCFSYLTTFTIAFGDLQPASVAARLLVMLQVAASAAMLFGLVAVIVSSYVGVLAGRRELLLQLRSGSEPSSRRDGEERGDQPAGRKDDETAEEPAQLVGALPADEALPESGAEDSKRGLVQDDADRPPGETSDEELPLGADELERRPRRP